MRVPTLLCPSSPRLSISTADKGRISSPLAVCIAALSDFSKKGNISRNPVLFLQLFDKNLSFVATAAKQIRHIRRLHFDRKNLGVI
jgi:hypothetical protein